MGPAPSGQNEVIHVQAGGSDDLAVLDFDPHGGLCLHLGELHPYHVSLDLFPPAPRSRTETVSDCSDWTGSKSHPLSEFRNRIGQDQTMPLGFLAVM